MSEKKILTAEEAARIIGCSPQKVRVRMQRKIWNIGIATPPKTGTGKWSYDIVRSKLDKLLQDDLPSGGERPPGAGAPNGQVKRTTRS